MSDRDIKPGKIDIDALERKARVATPGPWGQYESMVCGPGESANDMDVADCALGSEPEDVEEWTAALRDAAYIAATSPDVTLALIARIRELETALFDAQTLCRNHGHVLSESRLAEILERGTVTP